MIMNKPSKQSLTGGFAATALNKSDAELLAACRGGDEAAWQMLVERFQRLVATVPRRAGLNEDLTAEVFQEVFLTLFEKMNDIREPERLRSWLVTTAKFKTWRALAREKGGAGLTQNIEDDDESFFEVTDTQPLADAVLIELEEQHQVRTAVAALDERCRTILTMLYFAEPPAAYVAVAEKIGVGETSVSPLRARCLKKMLKMLA